MKMNGTMTLSCGCTKPYSRNITERSPEIGDPIPCAKVEHKDTTLASFAGVSS